MATLVRRPTLPATTDAAVKDAVRALQDETDRVARLAETLGTQIAAVPVPPTLAQVQQALSAGGSNPLNLTGLVGAPAQAASPAAAVSPGVGSATSGGTTTSGGVVTGTPGQIAVRIHLRVPPSA